VTREEGTREADSNLGHGIGAATRRSWEDGDEGTGRGGCGTVEEGRRMEARSGGGGCIGLVHQWSGGAVWQCGVGLGEVACLLYAAGGGVWLTGCLRHAVMGRVLVVHMDRSSCLDGSCNLGGVVPSPAG
jgi:hypothetical protein